MASNKERGLMECISIDVDINSASVIGWVNYYQKPEEIFTTEELTDWAISNGFVKGKE